MLGKKDAISAPVELWPTPASTVDLAAGFVFWSCLTSAIVRWSAATPACSAVEADGMPDEDGSTRTAPRMPGCTAHS